MTIFGQHADDLVLGHPGCRAAAAWGIFVSARRRAELSRAAFVAARLAAARWLPESLGCDAPRGVAERRLFAAELKAEAATAGIEPAAVTADYFMWA